MFVCMCVCVCVYICTHMYCTYINTTNLIILTLQANSTSTTMKSLAVMQQVWRRKLTSLLRQTQTRLPAFSSPMGWCRPKCSEGVVLLMANLIAAQRDIAHSAHIPSVFPNATEMTHSAPSLLATFHGFQRMVTWRETAGRVDSAT